MHCIWKRYQILTKKQTKRKNKYKIINIKYELKIEFYVIDLT
jgi:hypothetical protein